MHQLRTENVRLEDHVTNLIARRDHLLAVNARLAIPLATLPHAQGKHCGHMIELVNNLMKNLAPYNNMHMNGPSDGPQNPPRSSRPSSHGFQQQMPVENGIDFRHNLHQGSSSSIRYVS